MIATSEFNDTPLLSVNGLSKEFPGVKALDNVDLHVSAGEVLAVIGENGAGKSTLMKILAGVQPADAGRIAIDGKAVEFPNPRSAIDHGIVLIHQELNLCDNLNLGQNIFLGREPRRFGWLDHRRIQEQSLQYLRQVGLDLSPRTPLGRLTIGKQQMVEIAKALSVDARVLILDEPTSSLSAAESEKLFELIESLRERGVAIIYISHRLGEVERLADRVTVLRDGAWVADLGRDEIEHDTMVRHMVGRDVSSIFSRHPHPVGEPVLEVDQLRTPAWPGEPLSFTVNAGEIVGLAGLVGAGRTELLRVLFGIDRAAGGVIRVHGQPRRLSDPWEAIEQGIALVPEDRKQHGLLVEMHVRNNIGLPSLYRHRRLLGWANLAEQRRQADEMIKLLGVKTPSPTQLAKFLSGGNQQKVVMGKWLAMQPRLLLLDEPTRGIDVGAKQEIYRLIDQLASKSIAILFASSEMEEILGMSDRVLVMHEGRLSGELTRDEMSEEAIMHLATGGSGVGEGVSA